MKFDMTPSLTNTAATQLPRTAAGGIITIHTPGHATFDCGNGGMRSDPILVEVYLTPNGGAKILRPQTGFTAEANPEEITPEDTLNGIFDFLAAAAQQAGRNFVSVSVDIMTLAQLYAQRAIRQTDFTEDGLTVIDAGTWSITLPPEDGHEELTIFFSQNWQGVTAGKRTD